MTYKYLLTIIILWSSVYGVTDGDTNPVLPVISNEIHTRQSIEDQILKVYRWDRAYVFDRYGAYEGTSGDVFYNTMSGLFKLDKYNNVEYELCKSYKASDDGLTWTFEIKPDCHWSNGDIITAEDFVFAWQDIMLNGGIYNYKFSEMNIKNTDMWTRDKEFDIKNVGFRALDKSTIELSLDTPNPFLLTQLAHPSLHGINHNDYSDVTEKNKVIKSFSGPFVLDSYNKHQVILMKNDNYFDQSKVKLQGIDIEVRGYSSYSEKLIQKAFNLGEKDLVIDIELDNNKVKQNYKTLEKTRQYTWALVFNQKGSYFENKNLRLAMAYMMDRDTLTDRMHWYNILKGDYLIPEGLYHTKEGQELLDKRDYRIDYDEVKAQEHWSLAKSELGDKDLEVNFLVRNYQPNEKFYDYFVDYIPSKLQGLTINIVDKTYSSASNQTMLLELDNSMMVDANYSHSGNLYEYMSYYRLAFVDLGNKETEEFTKLMNQMTNMNNLNDDFLSNNLKTLEKLVMHEGLVIPLYQSKPTKCYVKRQVANLEYIGLIDVFDYENCVIE